MYRRSIQVHRKTSRTVNKTTRRQEDIFLGIQNSAREREKKRIGR